MNKNILTFLNEYAEIPDPQYAIMLRGAWGCGKTFFIRQWMEQLKNNRDADKLKWQPIYVSLYGLTTTQQITEQINKEISPWLYSKGMKLAKNVLKDTSIFQEANADKVSKSILGLSNESRNTFLHFLQSRYKYTSYGTEIEYLNECCQSDLPQLKLINEKLKTEVATRRLIEKYSIEKITNLIDEITAKVK